MTVAKVTVVMSTYNGSEYIWKQVETILNQKDVEVTCYIRDDGSTDDTREILKDLSNQYSNIVVDYGNNIGWRASFLEALRKAPKGDYYAFSDQDDIWFEDKIITSIHVAEQCKKEVPCLVHCNKLKTDENLVPVKRQQSKIAKPSSYAMAMVNGYAQGCSMLFNEELRSLVIRYLPIDKYWGHDYWVGLLAYLFGQVYYYPEPLFYHVMHGTNVSDTSNVVTNQFLKIKRMIHKDYFPNPSEILLKYYKHEVDRNRDLLDILNEVSHYKSNRFRFLMNRSFYPKSRLSKIFYFFTVAFGRY